MLGEIDRLLGGVRARAGHDRHPATRLIDAPFNHELVLLVRQRRAFAGGADRNQPIGALGDLPVDQGAEGFLIDGPVAEWGDERSE